MRIYTTRNKNLGQILQSRQPLPRIPNLSYPRVGILPEGEKNANQRLSNFMSGPNLLEMQQ
jgi:hypothetical protein